MSNVYIIMRALHHYVAALRNAPFNMPSHLVDPLEVSFRKRAALIFSDLHYASALFNPQLIYDIELRNDQHAMAGFMRVFQKLSNIDEEFQAIKVKFNLYFYTLSPYYEDHVWSPMGVKEVAHVWWFTSDSVGKLLPRIVRKILAQWCLLPLVSGIGVATPLSRIKHRIDCNYLVHKTWCMYTPTQES
jgi:hypothetical protein